MCKLYGCWGVVHLDLAGLCVLGSQPCGHWFVQSTENCMRIAHIRGDCKRLEENRGGLRRDQKQPAGASRDTKSDQQTPEETRNAFRVQERDRMIPEEARRVQKETSERREDREAERGKSFLGRCKMRKRSDEIRYIAMSAAPARWKGSMHNSFAK